MQQTELIQTVTILNLYHWLIIYCYATILLGGMVILGDLTKWLPWVSKIFSGLLLVGSGMLLTYLIWGSIH